MYKTLLLLTAIALVIMSAWSLNTFLRLKKASTEMSKNSFEDTCHVSVNYTRGGEIIAIVMLVLSSLVMLVTLYEMHTGKSVIFKKGK